jgi:hypothetical protein
MRLVDALKNAMRTRRTDRIGRADADRLISGSPPGPGHRGLGVLLDAAAAAPSGEELAGERAAVARFVAAYRDAPPTRPPNRASRRVRMVAIKVAAAAAVLAAGGTAVAAETGNLPAGARQVLTGLGVPVPAGGPRPTATGTGRTGVGTHVPSPATPAPSSGGAAPGPAEVWALDLCRSWDAARTNPHGKAVPAETRKALAKLAGGAKRIDGFCAGVLDASPSASASPSAGGDNHGNGNGNGKDKDKKPKPEKKPHPTPRPKAAPSPKHNHAP